MEIAVIDVQCKFKLSENRPATDRDHVIEELAVDPADSAREVAKPTRTKIP